VPIVLNITLFWCGFDQTQSTNGNADCVQRCRYSLGAVYRWGMEMADALEFMHTEQVLHRDLKSANVLLFHRDGLVAWFTPSIAPYCFIFLWHPDCWGSSVRRSMSWLGICLACLCEEHRANLPLSRTVCGLASACALMGET
jgi:serine/threonine protein kinase